MTVRLLLILLITLISGCETSSVTAPQTSTPITTISTQATVGNWRAQVLSEAFYALSQSRNGSSSLVYQGCFMSDWPYPWQHDCCGALSRVTTLMYGSNVTLRGGLGTWSGYQQGGQCKFFVNLVLYRSSYGYPGGHLFLPALYDYASRPWRDAQPGWVIQAPASNPHTAIIVVNGGSWLEVIDANWVGGNGRWLISRHRISAATLDQWGFRSYNPWEKPRLVQ